MAGHQRNVTISDVALAAGVAKSTVSLAFSAPSRVRDETRTRILEIAARVGYVPNILAQSLRTGLPKVIGLMASDIRSHWHNTFFAAAQGYASKRGFLVLGATSLDDANRELAILAQFRSIRVQGALITTSEGIVPNDIRFAEFDVPVVAFDQKVPGLACDHVSIDHRAATRALTRILLKQGHRRIGHVAGRRGLWSAEERLAGVREAMAEWGLALDMADVADGAYKEPESRAAARQILLREPRPTAIVAANSAATAGTLRAIRDLGLNCPHDVSLVAVDGMPDADLVFPQVTAAIQPVEEMATLAMDWLIDRMTLGSHVGPNRDRRFAAPISAGTSVAQAPA